MAGGGGFEPTNLLGYGTALFLDTLQSLVIFTNFIKNIPINIFQIKEIIE